MWIVVCIATLMSCEPDLLVFTDPEVPGIQASQQSGKDLAPVGDSHVSRTEPDTNFGAAATLRLDGNHRPLLSWDTLALVQAIGGDSLIEARLELTIVTNEGGWGVEGRPVGIHAMSVPWIEGEVTWNCPRFIAPGTCSEWGPSDWGMPSAMESPTPMSELGGETFFNPWNPDATDSTDVTNASDETLTFDVTADVAAILADSSAPYVHGWMLKLHDEGAGGEVRFGSRESGTPPRLILTLASTAVPFTPPDSLPSQALLDSIYSPENMVDDPRLGNRVPRNVLFLLFHSDASQEERQEAIDLVGGQVIGGLPVGPGGGVYIVRIVDDGTIEPLVQALETLESLPQVRSALASPPQIGPAYRKPGAGSGWGAVDWHVHPDSAQGDNWAPEAIAAPLAWGCETGRPHPQMLKGSSITRSSRLGARPPR